MKISLLALSLFSLGASAQNAASTSSLLGYVEGSYTVHNFKFDSGEVLPELHLAYVTLGTPLRGPSGEVKNAVLLLHGTANSSRAFLDPAMSTVLYGPGQPLDLSKYYLIVPDGIGHGRSSKPSEGLRAHFPHYGYEDMVRAQYRLVTERLAIRHLRLILGLSMGGMHAWLWGVRYPDAMDAMMPLGCYPVEIAGRNRLWRTIIIQAIRSDPAWDNGNYKGQPTGALATVVGIEQFVLSTPARLQETYPTRESFDRGFDAAVRQAPQYGDLNDQLYAFEASSDYNPQPELDKIKARVLAINFADDEINPPQLHILEREMPRVKDAQYIVVPATENTYGHSSLSHPNLWVGYLRSFLDSLGGLRNSSP